MAVIWKHQFAVQEKFLFATLKNEMIRFKRAARRAASYIAMSCVYDSVVAEDSFRYQVDVAESEFDVFTANMDQTIAAYTDLQNKFAEKFESGSTLQLQLQRLSNHSHCIGLDDDAVVYLDNRKFVWVVLDCIEYTKAAKAILDKLYPFVDFVEE